MINFEVFLIGLSIVSVLTGVVTEAVKHMLTACKKNYQANVLSGIVAALLSAAIGIGYVILVSASFTPQVIVCIIALAFMSWLSAMVGYDKVIQIINQFKK